jgi:hypothetical protein
VAVREFTDSAGVEWRVWDVTPQHMHPATRAEDFMGNLRDGWLVFESASDKRRLEPPYPAHWTALSLTALEELCRRATPVTQRLAQSTTGRQRAIQAAELETGAMRDARAQVTFRSPGGREWTVRVHECLDRAGTEQLVLRFTTEDIVVELSRWPDNWQAASVEQFGLMLLDANPPRRRPKGEGPQRRADDRVTLGQEGSPSSHEPTP